MNKVVKRSHDITIHKSKNYAVLIDGEPLNGVTNLKYEMTAGGLPKLTLEIYANVEFIYEDTIDKLLLEDKDA